MNAGWGLKGRSAQSRSENRVKKKRHFSRGVLKERLASQGWEDVSRGKQMLRKMFALKTP